MLDPVRLRSLELSPFHPFGLENFLGDGSTMSVFYNLRTLRLTLRSTAFTRVHASVAPFPAIRELIVHVNGACRADAIPTTSLASHLERYRGPAVLLPLVLACSGPEELIVTHGTAAEVLEALQTARHPDFITALSMRVKLYTDVRTSTVLQDILVLCPCLSRLTLEISSDGGIPTDSEGLELPSVRNCVLFLIDN
jgi:hypothetical protein